MSQVLDPPSPPQPSYLAGHHPPAVLRLAARNQAPARHERRKLGLAGRHLAALLDGSAPGAPRLCQAPRAPVRHRRQGGRCIGALRADLLHARAPRHQCAGGRQELCAVRCEAQPRLKVGTQRGSAVLINSDHNYYKTVIKRPPIHASIREYEYTRNLGPSTMSV